MASTRPEWDGSGSVSNDSMGNLEKLGILVIVILVVVVGVVAITPSETLFPEQGEDVASLDGDDAVRELEPREELGSQPVWPSSDPAATPRKGSMSLADWLRAQDLDRPVEKPDPPVRIHPTPLPTPKPVVHTPPTPTPTPRLRTNSYTVAGGDSFYGIAKDLFGSSKHWRTIAELNPDVDPARLRVGQTLRVPANVDAPTPLRRPARGEERVAAGEGVHVVQKGETLSSIAEQYLGNANLFRRIVEANSDTLPDPDRLKVGTKLRIPGAATRSGNVSANRPAPRGVSSRGVSLRAAGGRTVKVGKGESLSLIAARELGDAKYWTKLYEANRDVISNPDRLKVGAELRIP